MKNQSEGSDSNDEIERSEYAVGRPPMKGIPGHVYLVNVGNDSGLDGLFVPRRTAQQLLEDQTARKSRRDARKSRQDQATVEGSAAQPGRMTPAPKAQTTAQPGLLSRLLTEHDEDPVPEHHHRVWTPSDMRERLARHDARLTSDRELRSRDESALGQILRLGPDRPLLRLADVAMALRELRRQFPAFTAAIDLVAGGLAAGQRIPPILLVGPPGTGKTFFVAQLANALSIPLNVVDAASGVNSSTLFGVGRNWQSSEVGMLARILALAPAGYANPLVLVDEIDKEPRGHGNYPVATALLGLLEQENARQFRDLSLDIQIDASMVTWIATANRIDTLGAPLQSRLRPIVPSAPDASQMLIVATAIAHDVAQRVGLEPIPRFAIVELADRTPREIRQALQEAASRAILAGRTRMTMSDLSELLASRARPSGRSGPGGVGFH